MTLLERVVKTIKNNEVHIKSDNPLAKSHFDNFRNYADYIINQFNHNLYSNYLKGENLVILDIGANIGLFSLHANDCASIIYSFEPTPQHFQLLKEFTKDYNNIKPINIAISDKDSDIDFYLCDDNTTMNSIINKYGKSITVKGRSIISFLNENNINKVDFIKCDIEGSEMIALKEECIKPLFNIVDKWFIEVHPTENQSQEYNLNLLIRNFTSIGYSCDKIDKETIFVYKTK